MILRISKEDKENVQKAYGQLLMQYERQEDPWGLDLSKAQKSLMQLYPIYKKYFKVRLFGKEKIKKKQYMVISNHSGQIALDGLMIATAFVMETETPRILRPMVERFFSNLPFINKWASECGAVLGDRENCMNLLKRGESLLIFPEGVRGVSKSTSEFYQVQSFTKGFYRMAIKAGVEILPLAVVGAEEVFPYVYQAKGLAKKLGLPALPFSANYFPLPSPMDIYVGKPIKPNFPPSYDPSDSELEPLIKVLQEQIQEMLIQGLEKRRAFWPFVEKGSQGDKSE